MNSLGFAVVPVSHERDTTRVSNPREGEVVAVEVDDGLLLGTVGEKVAGGLYEVVINRGGDAVSGVFRLDELIFPVETPARGTDLVLLREAVHAAM